MTRSTANDINPADVLEFFNRLAADWDEHIVRNEAVLTEILNNAEIRDGVRVLDVGCGTGVLIPDYLARNVAKVTALDLSDRMIACARAKFSDPRVEFRCADIIDFQPDSSGALYDRCVIYNTYPHFANPFAVFRAAARSLETGGLVTVAHGASQATINAHHQGSATHVSVGLADPAEILQLMAPWFEPVTAVSNDRYFQVVARKMG